MSEVVGEKSCTSWGTQILSDLYTDDFSSRRGGGDGGGVKLHISIWKNSRWITNLIRGAFFSSSTGKLKKHKTSYF